ncbi:MAG: peptidoglycan editing factor PgeF [Alphaproteobacteria bacterium]|nr:peptidoglycan editing factor PgeF [Alphaproteobacteria bacterium]MBV9694561.1 peptidoglycan editing factor PgeF [Alphaproteobacteria bacterium]
MLILTAPSLTSPAIAHGFFGRRGGVSKGIFASLNCGPGSGDVRADVVENRRRAGEALVPGAALVTLYQVHSAKAVTVTEPWALGEGPQADAMATNLPGLALGILTADCAPVLLADRQARVVGAAHAGWKGALGGVSEAAIAAMEDLGAQRSRIAAAVGPCISQSNYEVGPEFRARFLDADIANAGFFAPSGRPEHFRFDLEGFVAMRLNSAGLASVEALCPCTYANGDDFFSFRRATHRRESDYGRQVSAIVLRS